MVRPKGVATDSEGHVYVVEGLNDVVQIFDLGGAFLMDFGGTGSERGRFFLPTAIHIDERDNIYVADPANRRIQVFRYVPAAKGS
jgi:DNA-binding beta-propeller fold protein YncE